jgi:hypothetical protein
VTELKQCPFCDGKAEVRKVNGGFGYSSDRIEAGCRKCDFWFFRKYPSFTDGAEEKATNEVIDLWNTRKGQS